MKGQNLRLFIGGKCIAGAKTCTWHGSAQLESASTKDDTGDIEAQEVVGKAIDIQAECVFNTADPLGLTNAYYGTNLMALLGTEVTATFSPASSTNNRTPGSALWSGTCIVNDMSITAANRETVTAQVQLTATQEASTATS